MTLTRQWSYPADVGSVTASDMVTKTVTNPATPGFILGADYVYVPTLVTAPPATSAASGASVNVPIQNTLGYDAVFNGYLTITAASVATFGVGVSATSTVTTNTLVSAYTVAGTSEIATFSAYVPAGYWYQLNATQANGAAVTATFAGQWNPI